MNKAIARNLDTDHIPVQRLCALLETFALKHSSKQLADLLEKAENENASYREFLRSVLETEVKGRNERRRKRNYSAAHFPPNVRPLEEFDPSELESGITDGHTTYPSVKGSYMARYLRKYRSCRPSGAGQDHGSRRPGA